MSMNFDGIYVNMVKRMQFRSDMENLWIMFFYVKCLRDWITMACHVYDNKH